MFDKIRLRYKIFRLNRTTLRILKKEHLSGWSIAFVNSNICGGWCDVDEKEIGLNTEATLAHILHEIAHAISLKRKYQRLHDDSFAYVYTALVDKYLCGRKLPAIDGISFPKNNSALVRSYNNENMD